MSKLYLSSLSLTESASIGVESNKICTLSMSSQSVLNLFYKCLKFESYGPDWYYITLDIGKLVINICHNFRDFRTSISVIIIIILIII